MPDEATLEHELKLLLPQRRVPSALALLEALCRRDARFPSNVVVSIYYDTRGFDLLRDKIDSQRSKTKVRLRWYERRDAEGPSSPAFAELKYRVGSRRRKLRTQTSLGAKQLTPLPLHHPEVPDISAHLPDGVFAARWRLLPLIRVRYQRRRFVDPASQTRVSLDTQLRVDRINRRLLPHASPGPLEPCVVEIKNRTGEIPPHLRPLLALGGRPASFSKYAAGFARALEPLSRY